MTNILIKQSEEIIQELLLPNGFFPNNAHYPLLIYKQTLIDSKNLTEKAIQRLLKQNHWINAWVDSIYKYDHYHSNNHEVLVIIKGSCKVQVGGDNGKTFNICQGDVIIFPAGVAHKNLDSTHDFKCIGAYPFDIDYDMNYGKEEEHPRVDENIKKVGLPKCDPVFGEKGLLFNYWK